MVTVGCSLRGSRGTPIHQCVSACHDDEDGDAFVASRAVEPVAVEQPQLVRRGRPAGMRDSSDALQTRTTAPQPRTVVRARRRPGSTCAWLFPGCRPGPSPSRSGASCVDRAEGLVLSCDLVRPYVHCHRVTVRGSTGARGDRSAEGT
jgi:hypothetical protein